MTKSQRTMIGKLKPLGFEPDGYDKRGHLIMRHPIAGFVTLSGTPGDARDAANTIAEARRRVRFAHSHHGQFLRWLYDYVDVQPGETKQFSASLHSLIRDYLAAAQIDTNTKQLHAIYESVRRYLKCVEPHRGGSRPSVWEVARPAAPAALKPASAPLAAPDVEGTPVPAEPTEPPTEPLAASPAVPVPGLPDGIAEALAIALAPNAEHLNRAALAASAIESLIDHLDRSHAQTIAELRSILGVLR